MADTIIVGCAWDSSDPGVYWFGISVDNGVSNTPVLLTATSTVLCEIQQGPNWSGVALDVALLPDSASWYAIRTRIPAPLANGQERTLRLTIDGVVYGPWVFRFEPPVVV